jgi:hypothetical protein
MLGIRAGPEIVAPFTLYGFVMPSEERVKCHPALAALSSRVTPYLTEILAELDPTQAE